MSDYSEKLKDPRWQKKRLEIFERDTWACTRCFDDQTSLAVHHLYYLPDTEPWDYPDDLLITLCEECHQYERDNDSDDLIRILKYKHFLADERHELAEIFLQMRLTKPPEVMMSILKWALLNPKIVNELDDRYFRELMEKREARTTDAA